MKFLLVVVLAVAASAKPDVSHIINNPSRTYIPQAPSVSTITYGGSNNLHTYQNPVYQPSVTYQNGGGLVNRYYDNYQTAGTGGSYQQTNFQSYTGPAQVQVTKHAYFFDSPDSGSVGQTRIHIAPAPIKKNVNLIFVKAPNYGHNTRILAQQQLQQEKTHVYVLVKNQEDNQDLTIPAAGPIAPSKPEVFFVKYKTQKEAEDKIQATLQGAHGAAQHAPEVGSEGALLGSIARESQLHHTVGIDNAGALNQQILDDHHSSGGSLISNTVPLTSNVVSTHTETINTDNHPGYTYKK